MTPTAHRAPNTEHRAVMFRCLPESTRPTVELNPWFIPSIIAHAVVISAVITSTNQAVAVLPTGRNVSAIYYLFPEARALRPPPKQESIRWVDFGRGAGSGGIELRDVEKTIEKTTFLAGRGNDVLSAPTEEEAPQDFPAADSVLSEIEVDSTVSREPGSPAPSYPADMLAKQIEGSAHVEFVVDTNGHIDSASFKVLSTTHPEFAAAVQEAAPLMRFRPAIFHSRKVRQLVQQNFTFKVVPP